MIFEEVRVENTNHCGYSCWFCPRETLSRQLGFMSMEDFETCLERIPHAPQSFDLHGFGEPLLDPNLAGKIKRLKSTWPELKTRIITTLGVKNSLERLEDIIAAGLNTIEVSFYGDDAAEYKKIHRVDLYHIARENLEQLKIMANGKTEVIVRRLEGASNSQSQESNNEVSITKGKLHNFGSGRKFNTAPESVICSVVGGYRSRVLQVTWDMNVISCCFDYNADIVFGNLRNQTLQEIFSAPTYENFIKSHIDNTLQNYAPCLNCEKCDKV